MKGYEKRTLANIYIYIYIKIEISKESKKQFKLFCIQSI